jgi:predicted DNA-binding protein (MmcQ/YjbR family)
MDYSYIFRSAVLDYAKFHDFGFEKQGDSYICKKPLSENEFYALLTVHDETLSAEVYERGEDSPDSKYALFDVESANGSFVSQIRAQVQGIVEDFRRSCFVSSDLHEKYSQFLEDEFACKPDFPWSAPEDSAESQTSFKSELYDDYAVYRCPNNKWFALVMNITYKNLGFENDEKVFVVNLKADKERISEIIDRKSIFPAYHMNKKHWITVLLTGVTDFDQLCTLTRRSFELVNGKK